MASIEEIEKEFRDALYSLAHEHTGDDSIEKNIVQLLYKLIDLRINPPKEKSKLKTLEEHDSLRYQAHQEYDRLRGPRPNGIECPKCKRELLDSDPTSTLMSNPPKKNIHCPSCDYVGYRIA